MKTAGKVLGIVGGALGIVISLFMIFMSILFGTLINGIENEYQDDFDSAAYYKSAGVTDAKSAMPIDSTTIEAFTENESLFADGLILPCVVFISSALGLVGGIIPNKKAGGILMIVGSAANITNFICFVLLLVGGILTLVSERKQYYPPYPPYYPNQPQYYPPQPYYKEPQQYYPPYPPQPYFVQPPQEPQQAPGQPLQQEIKQEDQQEGTDKGGDTNS